MNNNALVDMRKATIFNQGHRLEKDKLLQNHRDTILKKPIQKTAKSSIAIDEGGGDAGDQERLSSTVRKSDIKTRESIMNLGTAYKKKKKMK